MITDHVRPAQSIRAITDPHITQPRHCSVCNRELPAGYVKHRECR